MITYRSTPYECAKLVIALQQLPVYAILSPDSSTVTVYLRKQKWSHI